MLNRIIGTSLAHRWLVLALTLAVSTLGLYNFNRLAIDAVPERLRLSSSCRA